MNDRGLDAEAGTEVLEVAAVLPTLSDRKRRRPTAALLLSLLQVAAAGRAPSSQVAHAPYEDDAEAGPEVLERRTELELERGRPGWCFAPRTPVMPGDTDSSDAVPAAGVAPASRASSPRFGDAPRTQLLFSIFG